VSTRIQKVAVTYSVRIPLSEVQKKKGVLVSCLHQGFQIKLGQNVIGAVKKTNKTKGKTKQNEEDC
jgi:hypothetical protein